MQLTQHLVLRVATLLVTSALLLLTPLRLAAQSVATGTIEGRVANTAAGQFLKQVRIVVENSVFETLTNEAGEFRLTGVPVGAVTLRATAAGLDAQMIRLTVAAGQTTRHDFNLAASDAPTASTAAARAEVVKLDAFTVAERELSAQSAALQEQRTSANIKNVSRSRSSAISATAIPASS
jgi:iron complex outermembrane receptor protein